MFEVEASEVSGADSRPHAVEPSTHPPASLTHTTSPIYSSTTANTLLTPSQLFPVNSSSQHGLLGRDYSRTDYGGLPPALVDVRQVRKRVPTQRGREYLMDILIKRSTMVVGCIKQQVTILDGLQAGIGKTVVMSEVKRLEEYLKELDEVTFRLVELSEEETYADAFRRTLEEYEVIVVRAKQDAYKLLSSSSINSGTGTSSRRTTRSKCSSRTQSDVEHWLTQSEHSLAPISTPLHTLDALRTRLEQKVLAINQSQSQGHLDTIRPRVEEVESLYQELVDSTADLIPRLPDSGARDVVLAQLDAVESKVYSMKEQVYSQAAREERGRRRQRFASDGPGTVLDKLGTVNLRGSPVSSGVNSAHDDKAANLRTEADALRRIKDSIVREEARKKAEEIEERIARFDAEALKTRFTKGNCDHKVLPNKVSEHTKPSHSLGRRDTATALDCELSQALTNLVNLQSAPKPTLDTFSGDALTYTYFRNAFKDVVESCVSSERGRLNRLLTHTSGAAKELVQTCVYLADCMCFTRACELLDEDFGNKFKIARAYIKQLKDWPAVKGSDVVAWKKLHRFLLNCKTYKETGNLNELDRPEVMSNIITKLDAPFQDRWTAIIEKTERGKGREVNFDDLLEFIKVQSGQVCHLTFSPTGS